MRVADQGHDAKQFPLRDNRSIRAAVYQFIDAVSGQLRPNRCLQFKFSVELQNTDSESVQSAPVLQVAPIDECLSKQHKSVSAPV